jgi:translation initiation factor IF-1
MPGLNNARAANNGKGMSRSAVRKIGANRRMVDSALSGELEATHTFARITKVRGFCQMSVKLADGAETLATIRGVLKGGGPTRMKLGDVVLVEPLAWDDEKGVGAKVGTGGGPSHLIVGVLDSKQISTLCKAGTIPDWMARKDVEMAAAAAAASASGYTFGEDEEEEEGDAAGRKKKAIRFGAGAGAAADEEIDIDAI